MDRMTTLGLDLDPAQQDGKAVLEAILGLAERAAARLRQPLLHGPQPNTPHSPLPGPLPGAGAAVARLRGTGPGVSFRRALAALEADYPVQLRYPFEANERVGGAIWPGTLVDPGSSNALMKLRWEAGADDLPMHSHEHSDRCIIVLKGRGFFHVSDERVDGFTGAGVRTIAARERDVFTFGRGTVHTFSTFDEPMELLSCHLPFIPLADPRQYSLPEHRWYACERLVTGTQRSVELNGWAPLTGTERSDATMSAPAK